jgi:hypothetical protein
MPIDEPSGSQVTVKVDTSARSPDEDEKESVVITDFQPKSVERPNFIQRQNNEEKDYDTDDVEARMPQEKSSMKSSLKVEVRLYDTTNLKIYLGLYLEIKYWRCKLSNTYKKYFKVWADYSFGQIVSNGPFSSSSLVRRLFCRNR